MIGEFAQLARDYPKSVKNFDIAIGLEPDEYWPYVMKSSSVLYGTGDTAEARRIIASAPRSGETTPLYFLAASEIARFDRNYEELLALQDQAPFDWYTHQSWSNPKDLVIAEALELSGRNQEAQAHYESALALLEPAIVERPDDYRLYGSLGMALAGLGRKEEAIAAGIKATELMPIETDVYIGQTMVESLASTYTMLGEYDAALEQLDILLSVPATLSVTSLRLDPRWDPLRDHPRYQELIEKYS